MKKLAITTIIIAVIGLSLNVIFGWQTFSWLTPYRVNNSVYLYKFDAWGYVNNLKNSFTNVSTLWVNPPDLTWTGEFATDLKVIGNIGIFALNMFLMQFRIGGYMIVNILAILGINTITPNSAGGLNWLVLVGTTLRDLYIAYIV